VRSAADVTTASPARHVHQPEEALVITTAQLFVLRSLHVLAARARTSLVSRQRGQATTEYVLVLLGVAAIAIAVVAWATRSGKVGELLDRVFDHLAGEIA
jgi:hypothetical protein